MKWNKQYKEIDWCLALARIRVLPAFNVWGGGEVRWNPIVVWPLVELELRGKNERVARDARKPMITNFKVLGHWLTFQARSITQKSGK